MAKDMEPSRSITSGVVFAVLAVAAGCLWWVGTAADPADTTWPVAAKFALPAAVVFTVFAFNFILRRAKEAPFRPKDIARLISVGIGALGTILAMLNPWFAALAFVAAILTSVSGLWGGWWDKEVKRKPSPCDEVIRPKVDAPLSIDELPM